METKYRTWNLRLNCKGEAYDPDLDYGDESIEVVFVIEYSAYDQLQKRVEELEGETNRLAKELIDVQIEHPCYQLSKELEAENKKLRSLLSEIYLDASVDLQGVEENFEVAIKEVLKEVME